MTEAPRRRLFFLITSSGFGGAETLLQQTVARLSPEYECRVCSIKPKGEMARQIEAAGIRVDSLELDLHLAWWKPWTIVTALVRLVHLLREARPDILQASLFQADVFGAFAGTIAGVPVRLATLHMVLKKKWPALVLERLMAPLLSAYIAVSDDIRKFYCERLWLPERKAHVIYNFVDVDDLRARSGNPLPDGFRRDPKRPTAVMIGRLDPQKGLSVLVQAAALLRSRVPGFELWLVGTGPDQQRLQTLISDEGLEETVRFAGFQPDPIPFLAAADVLVLSSYEEGLPLVILEAMALSKPVAATSVGAVSEAVMDRKTGLLVPTGRADLLAAALETILNDPVKMKFFGENALKRVEETFAANRSIEKLKVLYQAL
jgi:glycosyltransferase involved in cell wall biosynthesis